MMQLLVFTLFLIIDMFFLQKGLYLGAIFVNGVC